MELRLKQVRTLLCRGGQVASAHRIACKLRRPARRSTNPVLQAVLCQRVCPSLPR